MKPKYLLITLKNLFLTAVTIIIALYVSEFGITLSYVANPAYISAAEENSRLLMMQFEHSSVDEIMMSQTNASELGSLFADVGTGSTENRCSFPLLDHLTDETKLDDALNIVVIGDSFVYGAYSLNRNETFWRVLENEMRADGIRVNVYGVGMTGANAYEELSWLTDSDLVSKLNPDLVIFGYVYNDPDDSAESSSEDSKWSKELPVISKIGKHFPNLYTRLLTKISYKTMYSNKYSTEYFVSSIGAPPILKGRFYEKYKKDFVEKLDNYAETADFPIAVMTLPVMQYSDVSEALFRPLEGLYKSCKNIRFYDCIKNFNNFTSSEHKKNYSVNAADFHPGSATNKFYADYIKDFIYSDFSSLITESRKNYEANEKIIINDYLPRNISLVKSSDGYTLEYPAKNGDYNFYGKDYDEYFLVEPLGKPHIKLSFSQPVDIDSLKVNGDFSDIEIYYTCINQKLGYDDHKIIKADETDGTHSVKNEKVTSVLICADFEKNQSRKLSISFEESRDSQ